MHLWKNKRTFFPALFYLVTIVSVYAAARIGSQESKEPRRENFESTHNQAYDVARMASYNAYNAPNDFTLASSIATPSVAYIKTTTANSQSSSFFDLFWGGGYNEPSTVVSSGSGVIVSADGYVVTNFHVIEKALSIEVVLNGKRAYTASLIGTDPSTDLALLKIDAKGLKPIAITNSSLVKVGEWVLAVGNPFNLTSTVTAGIVSAKGRNINVVNSLFPIESFIQTDAAINPGNSGGALVNQNGELIGINTAILSKTGAYNGYGFAVPSNIVKKVIEDLRQHGSVQRAFFGADVEDQTVNSDSKDDDLPGVVITELETEGGATRAGLLKDDRIVSIGGAVVNSKVEFDEQLSYYRPGDKLNVAYYRKGKTGSATVTLTNMEGTTDVVKSNAVVSSKLGATFELLSKRERDTYRIPQGIRVSNVLPNGTIARIGLPDGFIVTTINKIKTESVDYLITTLNTITGVVRVEGVYPNGTPGYFTFQIRR